MPACRQGSGWSCGPSWHVQNKAMTIGRPKVPEAAQRVRLDVTVDPVTLARLKVAAAKADAKVSRFVEAAIIEKIDRECVPKKK